MKEVKKRPSHHSKGFNALGLGRIEHSKAVLRKGGRSSVIAESAREKGVEGRRGTTMKYQVIVLHPGEIS